MYRNFFLFLCLIVLSASVCKGQEAEGIKTLVHYDPLFWKDKLKLDAHQCGKIKEINNAYYERLSAVLHENNLNRNKLQLKAAQSLLHRNQEIWETFHPKQRKRWIRMWRENTPPRLKVNET